MSRNLIIVLSHPIQYYSPLFKELAKTINLKVLYCLNPSPDEVGRHGFGKSFNWDIDLLEGYRHEFLDNISRNHSLNSFFGCDTPLIGRSIKSFSASHVVVFGWNYKSYIQAIIYCKKNNFPVAIRGDSQSDPNQAFWKRSIKKFIYPHLLNKLDAFLYVGQRNKEYLKSFSVPDRKLIFSPHTVDQDFWKGEKVNHKGITFMWVAKFIDKKRPRDVIRAFVRAFNIEDNIKLKMIGSGPLLAECIELSKANSNISFPGFKNQQALRKEYLSADALVLSSDYQETWGLVANEAFAAGIPAIVSNACGSSADLINDGTGLIFSLGNIEDLSKKMKLMVHNLKVKKYKDKVEREIENINKLYSVKHNVESFEKFLNF